MHNRWTMRKKRVIRLQYRTPPPFSPSSSIYRDETSREINVTASFSWANSIDQDLKNFTSRPTEHHRSIALFRLHVQKGERSRVEKYGRQDLSAERKNSKFRPLLSAKFFALLFQDRRCLMVQRRDGKAG